MIIISEARRLVGDTLHLGEVGVAALSAAAPSTCVAIAEKQRHPAGFLEIIVSSIPTEYWHDLWRLEIETNDTIGNIHRLLDVFRTNNIDVIFQEASIETFGQWNSTSIVFSGKQYANEVDGTASERMSKSGAELIFLEAAIKLAMLEQLRFSDAGEARCKITRFEAYRRLFLEGYLASARFMDVAGASIDADNGLTLPKRVRQMVEHAFEGAPIFYQGATDTKNRIVRLLLSCSKSRVFLDLGFRLTYAATDSQVTIFGALKRIGLNVIRHRLRVVPSKVDPDGSELRDSELFVTVVAEAEHHRDLDIEEVRARIRKEIDQINRMIIEGGATEKQRIDILP